MSSKSSSITGHSFQPNRAGRYGRIWWIVASGGGGAVGGLIAGLIGPAGILIAPFTAGTAAVLAQWGTLRHALPGWQQWVPATGLICFVGWALGGIGAIIGGQLLSAAGLLVYGTTDASMMARGATFGAVGGAVAGAVAGLLQRRLLPLPQPQQLVWASINTVAWSVSCSMYIAVAALWMAGGPVWKAIEAYAASVGLPLAHPVFVSTAASAVSWLVGGILTSVLVTWVSVARPEHTSG
jgi:hypothetical protein